MENKYIFFDSYDKNLANLNKDSANAFIKEELANIQEFKKEVSTDEELVNLITKKVLNELRNREQ